MNRNRHVLALAALGLAGLATTASAQVPASAAASGAAFAPSARQLAALCDTCAVVTATEVETRKGKASGVGAVGGAVVGGVIGRKAGDGSTVGTGVGAVAGGLLGHEIEKRAKSHKVWITTVTGRDGTPRRFEAEADPALKVGDTVRIDRDRLVKAASK